MLENIKVLHHSCVRIEGSKVLYFDPYELTVQPKDGDIVFSTHNHFDHFVPEDIAKVAKADAILVQPKHDFEEGEKIGYTGSKHVCLDPGESTVVEGIKVTAVAAHTPGHPEFHPKENNWVGFIVEMDGTRYYVTGDTYDVPEVRACKGMADVVIIPVGGKFTFTAKEAAEVTNFLEPKAAVPAHYGAIIGSDEDAEAFINALDPSIKGGKCR